MEMARWLNRMAFRFALFYDDLNTVRIKTKNILPFFPSVTRDLLGSDSTPDFAKSLLGVQGVIEVESTPYELIVRKSDVFPFGNVLNKLLNVIIQEIGEDSIYEFRPPAGNIDAIWDGMDKLKDTRP